MKLSLAIDEYWLDERLDFSMNTVRNYNYTFRYLIDYLGDVQLHEVTSNDVRRFLEQLYTERKLVGAAYMML